MTAAIAVEGLERAFDEVLAVQGIDLELALAGLLAVLGALALREMRRTAA